MNLTVFCCIDVVANTAATAIVGSSRGHRIIKNNCGNADALILIRFQINHQGTLFIDQIRCLKSKTIHLFAGRRITAAAIFDIGKDADYIRIIPAHIFSAKILNGTGVGVIPYNRTHTVFLISSRSNGCQEFFNGFLILIIGLIALTILIGIDNAILTDHNRNAIV